MLNSLIQVALSPVDIALSATKDVINVATANDEKDLGEETGDALERLSDNLSDAFESDK
jgi:hypothetical protein